jgi:hypothetical protein
MTDYNTRKMGFMRFFFTLVSMVALVNSHAQVNSDTTKSKTLSESKLDNPLLIVINGVIQIK